MSLQYALNQLVQLLIIIVIIAIIIVAIGFVQDFFAANFYTTGLIVCLATLNFALN